MPEIEAFNERPGGIYWHEVHLCYVLAWDDYCTDDKRWGHWHR